MTTLTSAFVDSTSLMPSMTSQYIYGIIPTAEALVFDVAGIDDTPDVATIGHAGLAFITSPVATQRFQQPSRADLLRDLAAHQRVIEAVMQDYPVLPVKFGTLLAGESLLLLALEQGAPLFVPMLEQFAATLQIEVVVLWDLPAIFTAIATEPAIMDLKAQIGTRPAEETLAERVALGRMVQESLQRRRSALHTIVLEALQDLALDMVVNPTMDDRMVINVALLIPEARRLAFDERLDQLDQHLGHSVQIRCVGPLPPYSFATIEIQQPNAAAIEEARQLLTLDDHASLSTIKRAYRIQAARLHPDHHAPGAAEAEERMAALTHAYRLLSAYAESQIRTAPDMVAHGDERQCSFRREDVEHTLLISVSRQAQESHG